MFQNPLRSQESVNNDPFSSLNNHGDQLASNNYINPFSQQEEQSTFDHSLDSNIHFVHPHYVHSYDRADGVHVEGYWRDGDGDTSHDQTVEDGGGYFQHNPDDLHY